MLQGTAGNHAVAERMQSRASGADFISLQRSPPAASKPSGSRVWTPDEMAIIYEVRRGFGGDAVGRGDAHYTVAYGGSRYWTKGSPLIDLNLQADDKDLPNKHNGPFPQVLIDLTFMADKKTAVCPPGKLLPLVAKSDIAFEPEGADRGPIEEVRPHVHLDGSPVYTPGEPLGLHWPYRDVFQPTRTGTIHLTLELVVGKERLVLNDSFRVQVAGYEFANSVPGPA